jgi:hypothetical protein
MSTVAEQYPARTDANGTTWYRPASPPGSGLAQWGWTSNAAMADPSYAQRATVCSAQDATAGDRAAVLEFAAQLRAQAAAGESRTARTPNPGVPVVAPGWLPALPTPYRVSVNGSR